MNQLKVTELVKLVNCCFEKINDKILNVLDITDLQLSWISRSKKSNGTIIDIIIQKTIQIQVLGNVNLLTLLHDLQTNFLSLLAIRHHKIAID